MVLEGGRPGASGWAPPSCTPVARAAAAPAAPPGVSSAWATPWPAVMRLSWPRADGLLRTRGCHGAPPRRPAATSPSGGRCGGGGRCRAGRHRAAGRGRGAPCGRRSTRRPPCGGPAGERPQDPHVTPRLGWGHLDGRRCWPWRWWRWPGGGVVARGGGGAMDAGRAVVRHVARPVGLGIPCAPPRSGQGWRCGPGGLSSATARGAPPAARARPDRPAPPRPPARLAPAPGARGDHPRGLVWGGPGVPEPVVRRVVRRGEAAAPLPIPPPPNPRPSRATRRRGDRGPVAYALVRRGPIPVAYVARRVAGRWAARRPCSWP